MKISRNAASPRSSLSNGPSFGVSIAAVGVGLLATAIAGACSTAILLIVDGFRAGGPPQFLMETLGYLSILIGSGYAAQRSSRRGWAHGALTALISFALLIFAIQGSQGYTQLGTGAGVQALLLVAFTGVAGGILGLAFRNP